MEGEHKYPLIKSSRFEHCDLWWIQKGIENWLEVKTIVVGEFQSRGSIEDIRSDLSKPYRLRQTDKFHHLAVILPLGQGDIPQWRSILNPHYVEAGMTQAGEWVYPLWQKSQLAMMLYSGI